MTKIDLVVSDVDGTLLTADKRLTDGAKAAVRRLHEAGIGFTITSSRPAIGMPFLIEPLGITLPIGPFNGSSIVDPALKPIEEHLIPVSTAKRSIAVLDQWLTRRADGEYVPHEKRAIRADPTVVADFSPFLEAACKIVGSSADPALLQRCEVAMRQAVGDQATAVRSQSYYLDVTPPDCNKGTFVKAIADQLGISIAAVATIGDMENDVPMFRTSGFSVAMGNAPEEVKKLATHVTASNENEGFAKAIEMILRDNESA
jgi:Cof subfamily protein (haloacid dehalogenase superfamily)